jgi:hypothetical protein
MFYLNLFLEGEKTALTNSHYFNITSKNSPTTTSSVTSTTTSSASSTSISTSSSQTSTAAPAATTAPAPSSSGLSAGVKAGIAVAVIGAAVLGVLAGWLILGRNKKANVVSMQAPLPGNQAPVEIEASYYDPAKIVQQPQPQQYPYEVGSERPPEVYELSPEVRRNN